MSQQKEGQAGPIMTAEQLAQANAILAQIEAPVKIVIWNALTGLLASMQNVPPHAVLSMAAMQAGHFMGSAVQGELTTVLALRKGFGEAFQEGVRKTKPNVKAMEQAPPNLRGEVGHG
jgi:hypothetical protein